MSTEVEQIIKAFRALTPEQRQELASAIEREAASDSPARMTRANLIEEVCGKYAHVRTSSEAFAARKREEIALED